ncbi:hypothetical protein Dda_6782 [Drechslerella dactyloides]|uniref:F-box domain-containing protein n=1 Tax=Drechslerella dactyloides TaxID=74499 RepID=A0AAD6NGH8_DREDA|nr:hypothetical protein Dda_6782 [Drechslerella dactyloides]
MSSLLMISTSTADKYQELLGKLETLLLDLAQYPNETENDETRTLDQQIKETFSELGRLQAKVEEEIKATDPLRIFARRHTFEIPKPRTFIDLPIEIHREIAKNLDGPVDLHNLMQSCRTMYGCIHRDNYTWWTFFEHTSEVEHMVYDPGKNYQLDAYTAMDIVTRRCSNCLSLGGNIMYYRRRPYRTFCRPCVELLFIQYRGFMEAHVLKLKIPQAVVGTYGRPRSIDRLSAKRYILKADATKLIQEERRWASFSRQRAIEFRYDCSNTLGIMGVRTEKYVIDLERILTEVLAIYRFKFTRYHAIVPLEPFRLFLERTVLGGPSKGHDGMANCEKSIAARIERFCESDTQTRGQLIHLAEHICVNVFGPIDSDHQEQMFTVERPRKMGAFFDHFLDSWFEEAYGELFREIPSNKEVSCRWCQTGPLYLFIPSTPADKFYKKDVAAHLFWCHSEILMTGRKWTFGFPEGD